MLNVTTLTIGELETNCYLVWDNTSQETIIIDPADSGDLISEKILELKLTPKMILLTHGHYDHCLACLELKLNFSIPILIHQKDLFLYQKANQSANYYGNFKSDPLPPIDQFIEDNQIIKIGREKLTVIHTPGHTPGSVCIHYHPERAKRVEGLLFSGDTLFAEGIGRTDFSYSSPKDIKQSLQKLLRLPPETNIFPGHGQPIKIKNAIININKYNVF